MTIGLLCNFFWRGANGRVVEVSTVGEVRAVITGVEWAGPQETSELAPVRVRLR